MVIAEERLHARARGVRPRGLVRRGRPLRREESLARTLGWLSVGLGLALLLTPRTVARVVGARPRPLLLRAFGLREMGSGVQILTGGPRPAAGVWSRVAGDALDLAALGLAFGSRHARRGRLAATTAAVAGVTALDAATAVRLGRRPGARDGLRATESIGIERPVEEVYAFWRQLENLPRFMTHLESVRASGDRRSHWVARGPAGTTVEWDAEITDERPNELIAWRTLPGARVESAGRVEFRRRPGGQGTILRVDMEYRPPAGALGAAVAMAFGEEPEQQLRDDLRRLKQVLEVGEVVSNAGPSARERRRDGEGRR